MPPSQCGRNAPEPTVVRVSNEDHAVDSRTWIVIIEKTSPGTDTVTLPVAHNGRFVSVKRIGANPGTVRVVAPAPELIDEAAYFDLEQANDVVRFFKFDGNWWRS